MGYCYIKTNLGTADNATDNSIYSIKEKIGGLINDLELSLKTIAETIRDMRIIDESATQEQQVKNNLINGYIEDYIYQAYDLVFTGSDTTTQKYAEIDRDNYEDVVRKTDLKGESDYKVIKTKLEGLKNALDIIYDKIILYETEDLNPTYYRAITEAAYHSNDLTAALENAAQEKKLNITVTDLEKYDLPSIIETGADTAPAAQTESILSGLTLNGSILLLEDILASLPESVNISDDTLTALNTITDWNFLKVIAAFKDNIDSIEYSSDSIYYSITITLKDGTEIEYNMETGEFKLIINGTSEGEEPGQLSDEDINRIKDFINILYPVKEETLDMLKGKNNVEITLTSSGYELSIYNSNDDTNETIIFDSYGRLVMASMGMFSALPLANALNLQHTPEDVDAIRITATSKSGEYNVEYLKRNGDGENDYEVIGSETVKVEGQDLLVPESTDEGTPEETGKVVEEIIDQASIISMLGSMNGATASDNKVLDYLNNNPDEIDKITKNKAKYNSNEPDNITITLKTNTEIVLTQSGGGYTVWYIKAENIDELKRILGGSLDNVVPSSATLPGEDTITQIIYNAEDNQIDVKYINEKGEEASYSVKYKDGKETIVSAGNMTLEEFNKLNNSYNYEIPNEEDVSSISVTGEGKITVTYNDGHTEEISGTLAIEETSPPAEDLRQETEEQQPSEDNLIPSTEETEEQTQTPETTDDTSVTDDSTSTETTQTEDTSSTDDSTSSETTQTEDTSSTDDSTSSETTQTEESSDNNTDNNSDTNTNDNTDTNTGDNTDTNTGDNTDTNTGDNTDTNTTDNTNDNTSDNTSDNNTNEEEQQTEDEDVLTEEERARQEEEERALDEEIARKLAENRAEKEAADRKAAEEKAAEEEAARQAAEEKAAEEERARQEAEAKAAEEEAARQAEEEKAAEEERARQAAEAEAAEKERIAAEEKAAEEAAAAKAEEEERIYQEAMARENSRPTGYEEEGFKEIHVEGFENKEISNQTSESDNQVPSENNNIEETPTPEPVQEAPVVEEKPTVEEEIPEIEEEVPDTDYENPVVVDDPKNPSIPETDTISDTPTPEITSIKEFGKKAGKISSNNTYNTNNIINPYSNTYSSKEKIEIKDVGKNASKISYSTFNLTEDEKSKLKAYSKSQSGIIGAAAASSMAAGATKTVKKKKSKEKVNNSIINLSNTQGSEEVESKTKKSSIYKTVRNAFAVILIPAVILLKVFDKIDIIWLMLLLFIILLIILVLNSLYKDELEEEKQK